MRKPVVLALAGLFAVAAPGTAQDAEVALHPPGVDANTRKSIDRALKFLAREQNKDGSWRSGGGYGSYPVAMTGLAGFSMMCSGSSPNRGPYARNVRKAARYVLAQQQPNGLFAAPSEESRSMYGHGFGMMFLAQVYGMEEDATKQRRIKAALRRGITLTARSQSRDGGWLYTPDQAGDEGSVTITQIQALRACRNAGLHVPKKTIDMAIRYIERSQNSDGGISYSVRNRGSRPAISAAACAVLYNAGVYDSPMADKCFTYCWRTCRPSGGRTRGHFFYAQFYMSQATWQKGDKYWNQYYPDIKRYLLRTQQGNGSWHGDHVGQVYGSAIGLVILQLPYSKLPILSR
ncbi:MAG: prenyltransferase/squalene oxidase repeat-containing protein [Planctomycetota bacterium]|jgi:squalene cyclase